MTAPSLHALIACRLKRELGVLLRSENGAITVDWVVITASIMALTIAVMTAVVSGTQTATTTVSSTVASQSTSRSW